MKSVFICCMAVCIVLPSQAQLLKRLRERKTHQAIDKKSIEPQIGKTGRLPQYENLKDWAAHPWKHDNSDSVPAGLPAEKRDSLADVFFIHPTSYTQDLKTSNWNADIDDASINTETENRSILNQASVFNGSCRVFAPHYRQAHLKVFFMPKNPNSQKALDTAYTDVKTAFEYYLQHWNKGRPIVIASHSQGSVHAIRLMQEFFDGKPLQKQLVCAYIIGWSVNAGSFQSIPLAINAQSVGGFVTWRTYRDGFVEKDVERESEKSLCINPITWTTQQTLTNAAESKGAIVSKDFQKLYKGIVQARVDSQHGILWVTLPQLVQQKFSTLNNYHILDYNLFWMDIRVNVKQRLTTWFSKQ